MSCANNMRYSHIVIPAPTREWVRRPALVNAIVAMLDALQEAWEMRRAIRKRYPFSDE